MAATRPTSDRETLLRAIMDAPADDAPRLALADWFTENGQEERGEFVRVQCELARTKKACHTPKGATYEPYCGCRWHALRRRERALFEPRPWLASDGLPETGRGWYTFLDQTARDIGRSPAVVYRRGFVSSVSLDTPTFLGGPCRRCEGRGKLIGDPECSSCRGAGRVHDTDSEYTDATMDCPDCDSIDCPACSGTGRREGIAATLAASVPLEAVRLSDKRPAVGYPPSLTDHLHDGRPFWLPADVAGRGQGQPHWLPTCLKLTGGREGERGQYSNTRARYYDSIEEAEQDSSRAAVAYLKSLRKGTR